VAYGAVPLTPMPPLALPDRLLTERLFLRPWVAADADALRAALEESVEHLLPWIPWATPEAPGAEETRALLDGWIAQRASGESFIYAILQRDGGLLLGGIGLYARVGPGRLEVGYWLRRTASGLGFATEAAAAIGAAGLALAGVHALEIHTDPRNLASMRIPTKLGYRRVDTASEKEAGGGAGRATVVFLLS
jgi:RimJ/RimL family protein N-acetyltransferase